MSMERGSYTRCINRLQFIGFSEQDAKIICSQQFFAPETNDDMQINLIDKEDYDQDCVSRKIPIFKKEHPDWDMDRVKAASIAWCRENSKKDSVTITNKVKPRKMSNPIERSRFQGLIQTIKTGRALKVAGMGILPFKTDLPMKNLNRLQTKLEKMFTEEQRWLTAEQLLQRSRYAAHVKKSDSVDVEDYTIGDALHDFIMSVKNEYPLIDEEALLYQIISESRQPEVKNDSFYMNGGVEFGKINDGLNNIIKVPIVLARVMIQDYMGENGKSFKHFKSPEELKKAAERVDKIPVIIEHQDNYTDRNIVGWAKNIHYDTKKQAIKGMGYLTEAKIPETLKTNLDKGIITGVSVGFIAHLGQSGEWEGQPYDFKQEDIYLDHLAICLETEPRCPTGFCGMGLDSIENPENPENIVINKGNYYINICELFRDSKETKNESEINIEEDKMEDSLNNPDVDYNKLTESRPDDLKAIFHRLYKEMGGDYTSENKNEFMNRFLEVFNSEKKKTNSSREKYKDGQDECEDNIKMDNTEIEKMEDSIASKDAEIEELKKILEDSQKKIKEFEEKERTRLADSIKSLTNKYSEEELGEKSLKDLELIEDTITKILPSNEKAQKLPVEGKDKDLKEEMEDSKNGRRIDPRSLHDDVNKRFDLSAFGIYKDE